MKELNKQIKEYVTENNRLAKKYGYTHIITTVEEFWQRNYVEDEIESIEYYGGKNYAQFELHNTGVIPAEEVEAWK